MRRFAAIFLLITLAACAKAPDPGVHRHLVFFQEWSANLDAEAMDAVNAAAAIVKRHPGVPITVIGFADPEGIPKANRDISHARAQMVTEALVKAGVPTAQITPAAKGATAFVSTPLESRRVEIMVNGR